MPSELLSPSLAGVVAGVVAVIVAGHVAGATIVTGAIAVAADAAFTVAKRDSVGDCDSESNGDHSGSSLRSSSSFGPRATRLTDAWALRGNRACTSADQHSRPVPSVERSQRTQHDGADSSECVHDIVSAEPTHPARGLSTLPTGTER